MRNRADAVSGIATSPALMKSLPPAKPEDVGLSPERLDRIGDVFLSHIVKGTIGGAVVAIARRGKLGYCEAFGFRDKQRGMPMQPDAIFRIASMTKPFTSVAAMVLVEEGKLLLSDPVSKYLPVLASARVSARGSSMASTPVQVEMTVHDLLRHTSGLTRSLGPDSPVRLLYRQLGVQSRDQTLAEQSAKLAGVPLAHQPGTMWDYSISTDVLARVVEVASGMSFDAFLSDRIWRPLRLNDTGFHVPDSKWERLAEAPEETLADGEPRPFDVKKPPKLLSGGGGMVSTAADYLRFAQMLLNGGTLDGARVLGHKTLAYMTTDHLGAIARGGPDVEYIPGPGYGFGLGFAVREAQGLAPYPGSVGDFYWGGIFGTNFWVDPQEQLVGLLMMQAPSQRREFARLTRGLVYQALAN